MKQPKIQDSTEREFTIGQAIRHTKFGTGEIINVIPGEAIKVQFGKTQRILLLKYNKTSIEND
jgi:hypothetical protein